MSLLLERGAQPYDVRVIPNTALDYLPPLVEREYLAKTNTEAYEEYCARVDTKISFEEFSPLLQTALCEYLYRKQAYDTKERV